MKKRLKMWQGVCQSYLGEIEKWSLRKYHSKKKKEEVRWLFRGAWMDTLPVGWSPPRKEKKKRARLICLVIKLKVKACFAR